MAYCTAVAIDPLPSAETYHGSRVVAGSIAKEAVHLSEEDDMRHGLLTYHNRNELQVHFAGESQPQTTMLSPFVDFYNFALLDGKRLTPTTRSRRNTAGSSLIQARYEGVAYAGEIRNIIRHRQPGVSHPADCILAHISWMKRSNLTPLNDGKFPWDDLCVYRSLSMAALIISV